MASAAWLASESVYYELALVHSKGFDGKRDM
jgi:hypothetical protein